MDNRGTANSEKGAPFLLNEGILRRQMDKFSATLAKNTHVKLLKFHMQNMFRFYFHDDRLLEYEEGLHGTHRKRVHTFPMSDHERVFNIDDTLGSGRTPGVSILDSE